MKVRNDDLSNLIRRARAIRRCRGLSWRELSRQTGVPVSTLFGWLEEGRRIPASGLVAISEILDLKDTDRTGDRPAGFTLTISMGRATFQIARVPLERSKLRDQCVKYVRPIDAKLLNPLFSSKSGDLTT